MQTELLPVSSESKSSLILGDDSSSSWVFLYALGHIEKEELQAVMLGGGLMTCGELTSSSTFAALQVSVSAETLALGRIKTLSFSPVFIDYP